MAMNVLDVLVPARRMHKYLVAARIGARERFARVHNALVRLAVRRILEDAIAARMAALILGPFVY